MTIHRFSPLVLLISLLIIFASCTPDKVKQTIKIQFVGEAQGTYYSLIYFAHDTLVSQAQVDSLLTAFDLSASIWVKESIISKINNNEPGVIPDKNFVTIFKQSKKISQLTDGAFDITVGPLVNAWGFGFKNKIDVTQRVIDSLLPLVNFDAVNLVDGKIIKDDPGIHIDYNAIAQGYSVDLLGGFLEKRKIPNYLIDIGGEVLAKGNKPNGDLWLVGIEKPAQEIDSQRELKATIAIQGKAVATSGNYRKFYEVDGIRYSHTINPKTGYPVKHSLLSVTVLSDSASIADAFATSFMVMGLEDAKLFLDKNPTLEAYFIFSDSAGEFKTWMTPGLSSLINEQ